MTAARRFQIERLEESGIAAANAKTQRSERSRQLIENKDRPFSHALESRQIAENNMVIQLKAVSLLKRQAVTVLWNGQKYEAHPSLPRWPLPT
jgi:hypothetical protein